MSTSGPSLTSGQLDLQGSPQLTDDTLGNELDDQDRRLPPSKSPSDLFSDVYRGIRKAIPTREDSLRFARAPSRLAFKPSPPVPLSRGQLGAPFIEARSSTTCQESKLTEQPRETTAGAASSFAISHESCYPRVLIQPNTRQPTRYSRW